MKLAAAMVSTDNCKYFSTEAAIDQRFAVLTRPDVEKEWFWRRVQGRREPWDSPRPSAVTMSSFLRWLNAYVHVNTRTKTAVET